MVPALLAAVFALSAAIAWGTGDFIGGFVSRRIGAIRTILISYSVGLAMLTILALMRREAFPPFSDLFWGCLSGLSGLAGFAFLLRGFSHGRMGIVAPVSAVLSTLLPVLFTAITIGLPHGAPLAGIGLALVSIWLLSRPERFHGRPAGLGSALLAGMGFGGLFIGLDQVHSGSVFWPLAVNRLAACLAMVGIFVFQRLRLKHAKAKRGIESPSKIPYGLLALGGTIDVVGNYFFLTAIQSGRLDIAAVLASLYPAVTALWARVVSREHLTWLQVIGVGLAVVAIALITI